MIIVKLMGGLGNQMFQYATGFALAKKQGVPLHLDLSFLELDPAGAWTKRAYELDVFGIAPNSPKPEEKALFQTSTSKWQRLWRKLVPISTKYVYATERGHGYQNWFNELPANVYLEGFWQNEKYFKQEQSALKALFLPKIAKPTIITELERTLREKTTVSIHVRRGDYVALKGAGEFHGICSPEYYAKAIRYLESRIGPFSLMVFSDDPDWCATSFNHPHGQVIVKHNEHAAWDLYLMSHCHHNIIANSSFSWWAAWLNNQPGAIVILPQQWFANQRAEDIGINASGWIML